tara:strand:+ start:382 stop:513 length:132 start_codon:yes stop_codon:yes gene_type:complete
MGIVAPGRIEIAKLKIHFALIFEHAFVIRIDFERFLIRQTSEH